VLRLHSHPRVVRAYRCKQIEAEEVRVPPNRANLEETLPNTARLGYVGFVLVREGDLFSPELVFGFQIIPINH
jgi:hypothetical protein